MGWIAGGRVWMGSDEPGFADARAWHRLYVDEFWMDQTEVPSEQFERFAKATNCVTVAERAPTKEEFPTAPAENHVDGSVVFTPPNQEVRLDILQQCWSYVKGAQWQQPTGPGSGLIGKNNIPS